VIQVGLDSYFHPLSLCTWNKILNFLRRAWDISKLQLFFWIDSAIVLLGASLKFQFDYFWVFDLSMMLGTLTTLWF
jgi:hypothetical protein